MLSLISPSVSIETRPNTVPALLTNVPYNRRIGLHGELAAVTNVCVEVVP